MTPAILKSEYILLGLVIVTAIVIPLQSILHIEKDLPFSSEFNRFSHDNDSGGKSYGTYAGDNTHAWTCHIVASPYTHPFCGHQFFLNHSISEGLDLSSYDTIILDITYFGKADTARVFLRNFNPKYSRIAEDTSTKYNTIEFEVERLKQPFEFELSRFKVADWWLAKRNIPFKDSEEDISNVTILEIQTGSYAPIGDHFFSLNKLTVKKRLIQNEPFYLGLLVAWIITIIGYLAHRLYTQKQELSKQRSITYQLLEENKTLDQLTNTLSTKSQTDKLTGLLNREGIDQAISFAWQNFKRQRIPFSYILFDIDHFKSINDKLGHDAGDRILVDFAQLVKKNVREGDVFARWGGEEFLLICNNSDLNAATHMATKIRKIIELHSFRFALNITASFGVATMNHDDSLESLFKKADIALYRAKENGRNQVSIHHDEIMENSL